MSRRGDLEEKEEDEVDEVDEVDKDEVEKLFGRIPFEQKNSKVGLPLITAEGEQKKGPGGEEGEIQECLIIMSNKCTREFS